ncbi:MAG: hypothetical protein GX119_11795 [Syntrophomonadaceae bacterium]|nr:hypothetical protein [Syntrophomonadaceae bacterium]
MVEELIGLDDTVFGSQAWKDIENLEYSLGSEALLDQILQKDEWSNVEMLWVIKCMVYYYGKKDKPLKGIPVDRMFLNMVDILRCLYLLLDYANPELDSNMRKYLSVKLGDATWGLNSRTRSYLYKLLEKQQ